MGSYYSSHIEHRKYAHLLWGSLNQSVYLSLQDMRVFDPIRHYCFGTNRHFTEVTHDEIEYIRLALLAAREAFLQSGLQHTSLSASESDLRAVLGRINYHRGSMYAPFGMREVTQAVLEETRRGNLIFVPRNEDLRECVKAIQEDRQRQATPRQLSRSDRFDSETTVKQNHGNPSRAPQNFDTPLYSSSVGSFPDAQPFEYQPDTLSEDAFELAGISRGDMYACDIISSECRGSVLREFPSQYLDSTYYEIQGDARDGVKDARKALKLLNDNRFKK